MPRIVRRRRWRFNGFFYRKARREPVRVFAPAPFFASVLLLFIRQLPYHEVTKGAAGSKTGRCNQKKRNFGEQQSPFSA